MIDIQTYRARIGTYSHHHGHTSCLSNGKHDVEQKLRDFHTFSLTLLVVLGLAALCAIQDPAIETNPGPTFQSKEETACYNSVRKLNTDIARSSSHRFFLRTCKDLGTTPRGYKSKQQVATAKPNSTLLNNHTNLQQQNSLDRMEIDMNHYDTEIPKLLSQKKHQLEQLKNLISPPRFEELASTLVSHYTDEVGSNQAAKMKKLNREISMLDSTTNWLPMLNLHSTEKDYITNDQQLCDNIINASMQLIMRENPLFRIQSSTFNDIFLSFCPEETLHIHHNGQGHFVTSASIGGTVTLYDSMNSKPTPQLLKQIAAIYSPDANITPQVNQVRMPYEQKGGVDCGLFAIAYAFELALGHNPCNVVYDQSLMRDHLLCCLEAGQMCVFPRYRTENSPNKLDDVTRHIPPTEKWSTPSNTSRRRSTPTPPPIPTHNRYSVLSNATDGNPQTPPTYSPPPPSTSPLPATQSTNKDKQSQKTKSSKVINLTNRNLTHEEMSVLELGLNFCPSVQHYNKEQLADDCFRFIRRLKLREFFHRDGELDAPGDTTPDEDRCDLKWQEKNPDWYPDKVIDGRSAGLVRFIDEFLRGTRKTLEDNESEYWNNLNPKQRSAITSLAKDQSIVIKPSDKCGSVVIMNVSDYERACLDVLTNSEHYLELPHNPNPQYKELVLNEVEDLKQTNLISEFEYNNLIKGSRTPIFYGLPKMHNAYSEFPSFRPISSGTDSCTSRLSEFVDSFLKAAASKVPSYIKDTTDFVKKIRLHQFPSTGTNVHLATMDVTSLYPNIDQEEGAEACKLYMDKRSKQSISSSIIKKLIILILQCNTLIFKNRFFHQIKGTAMGTPMAVNFANLFMAKFETEMLRVYSQEFGKQPALWLRYIDDIFIVWVGDAADLKHFMEFCNNYAASHSYASTIRFKYSPPSSSVNFLDTTITLQPDGSLSSTLYCKPTAAHQYLHNKSYHVSHVTNSLPKSQFMRIRRICTFDTDYTTHADRFVNFFVQRGYKQNKVLQMRNEVASMSREDLLAPKPPTTNSTDRIPLVITYHHKFSGIAKVLRRSYQRMLSKHSDSAKVFPAPPFVAYRRTANIKDKIVRANHHKSSSIAVPVDSSQPSFSTLEGNMNNTGSIKNNKGNRKCRIQGGPANTIGAIYAGHCTKHDYISVGQTGGPVNVRFNGHRSDVKLRPWRTELDTHFSEHDCDFDKDLSVSILEQVTGSESLRLYKEDKWMTRLNTVHPYGLNKLVREFGHIYATLFTC